MAVVGVDDSMGRKRKRIESILCLRVRLGVTVMFERDVLLL